MDRGTYLEHDGLPAVRFQRIYPHAIERVWSAVTEPGELAHWFPSTVKIELRPGGTIEFFDDPHTGPTTGRILAVDPPRRLSFTWGRDELHFELEPIGDDSCQLTLINVLEARDTSARNAAGWSVCLAELDKHLSGAVADGPHSATAEPWRMYYDAYVADGMPSGAAVPGETEHSRRLGGRRASSDLSGALHFCRCRHRGRRHVLAREDLMGCSRGGGTRATSVPPTPRLPRLSHHSQQSQERVHRSVA